MPWIDLAVAVSGLPALAASVYLAALALLARRQTLPAPSAPHLRFDVVVPAHDEEMDIGRTVESLQAVDYPRELFRVLVIADNCGDRTGACAAAAGAQVMERNEPSHRGKGYAVAYAFRRSLADGFADAIVVVDADTVVSSNLLSAFAGRFETGAMAVQADYGVRNPRSSWRTRLMTIALATFHGVRSLARERLGISCGLRGNGMGFANAVLRAVPYSAFSIVEDLEYGLQLGYAGIRVQYVHEARVLGQMVVTERASRSQRRRWEGGRQVLIRQHVRRLLGQAWHRRDLLLLDLALDLLVPPLGHLVALNAIGGTLCVLAAWLTGGVTWLAACVWGASFLGILLYVVRGWALSGVGPYGLLDLLWAPVYVMWKLTLRFRDRGKNHDEWIRTTREARM
jgi:cellulose synthase/poly-beta-1,6-N-acetylglucosamine synthase-like glycosyltransferase